MTITTEIGERVRLGEPIVVLSYAYSGVARLRALLTDLGSITWIDTDLAKACGQLASSWQAIEGHGSAMSRLAEISIRTHFNTMITACLSANGTARYCFPADAASLAPDDFLRVYPKAKFLCLHRRPLDVIYTAVAASPWGFGGGPCASFAQVHPGNAAAAAAGYWAQQSRQMLTFESAHPERALRLRYEDLDSDPLSTVDAITSYVDVHQAPDLFARFSDTGGGAGASQGVTAVGCGADVPRERIPPPLRDRINDLAAQLGYDTV